MSFDRLNFKLPWLTVAKIIRFAMIVREISDRIIRAHVFGIVDDEFCVWVRWDLFRQWCHTPLTLLHNVGIVASHSTRDMVKPGKDNVMDLKD